MINQTIGRYRIIQQLGVSGLATVYKAYDPICGQYVALKVLPGELSKNASFRQAFQRKAKILDQLSHPNILAAKYNEENDTVYLVMQYIESGYSLQDRIREHGPLPFEETSRIFIQIAGAIDHAHQKGILHLDVKPRNVLIDKAGTPYLVDFGIAIAIVETIASSSRYFTSGTPGYISPEQFTGKGELSSASDIYSLGVVLYEMVTGHRPFEAETPMAVIIKQLHGLVPSPRSLRPDLSEAAELVLFKALNVEPELRYQTASQMAIAFTQATANITVDSTPSANAHKLQETKWLNQNAGLSNTSILFLAADPTDASRLRLGEEIREIQEKLQLARLREKFELYQRMSVRPSDISQALLDIQPNIVHFSGHGTSAGALCFENQMGEMHPIEPDSLAALFEQFTNHVNCVILNACYSEIQANVIAKHIDYVVGMNQAIGDKAAIAFAVGFYQALGAGRTIEEAFKLGCVQIRLQGIPEHLTPVLIKKGASQS
jgi:serine/threonine protein kinase